MKISFSNFWPGFDYHSNFLTLVFKNLYENVEITTPDLSDVHLFGPFGKALKDINHRKKIFYTGENLRPNFDHCHYSLTFDKENYNGKNFRLPLWHFYIDWFNVNTYKDPKWLIPVDYLFTNNTPFYKKTKNKFCVIVNNHANGEAFRRKNDVITIRQYKDVDVYGGLGKYIDGNLIRLPSGEDEKIKKISEYKFSMCYENSIYPGYHTEKLLHAKIAGNIPLYYGANTIKEDFNENCFIDTTNFTPEELLNKIKEIDENEDLYKKILNEPLFKEKISLDKIYNNIDFIIKQ